MATDDRRPDDINKDNEWARFVAENELAQTVTHRPVREHSAAQVRAIRRAYDRHSSDSR